VLISGTIEYTKTTGETYEKKVQINTDEICNEKNNDILDAVAFALYGKTIFKEIVRLEPGLPFIVLTINSKNGTAVVGRKPEHYRVTHFGTEYNAKEYFSLTVNGIDYNEDLSAEQYYQLLNEYLDLSYDEFVAYCRS